MHSQANTPPIKPSRWSFFRQVLMFLAPLVASIFGLRWLASLGYRSGFMFEAFFGCVVIGSVVFFGWSLSRRVDPWRSFRVWLCVQLGLLLTVAAVVLMGPVVPPPSGTIKCGTGMAMLFLTLLAFVPCYAMVSWIVFGLAKKGVEALSPNYYVPAYVWGGEQTNECGEGSLALAGYEESEGALSLGVFGDFGGELSRGGEED